MRVSVSTLRGGFGIFVTSCGCASRYTITGNIGEKWPRVLAACAKCRRSWHRRCGKRAALPPHLSHTHASPLCDCEEAIQPPCTGTGKRPPADLVSAESSPRRRDQLLFDQVASWHRRWPVCSRRRAPDPPQPLYPPSLHPIHLTSSP